MGDLTPLQYSELVMIENRIFQGVYANGIGGIVLIEVAILALLFYNRAKS